MGLKLALFLRSPEADRSRPNTSGIGLGDRARSPKTPLESREIRNSEMSHTRWRPMLEKALGSNKAVAIFVGPGEMGSWQQKEVDIALDLQSKSPSFPVIPVLTGR
jgi:hypothetical protein